MARRDGLKEKVRKLGALVQEPVTEDTYKKVEQALAGSNSVLAAKAAEVAGSLFMTDLIPRLIAAYACFLENPLKRDKGCLAKTAVITALDDMDYDGAELFVKGVGYRQIEPGYMQPVDTAAVLRGKCAFALVRIGYPGVVFHLVDLLADPEVQARTAGVKALAGMSLDISEPLLRLKAVQVDEEQQVAAECLFTLMQVNPERSLAFVERFLPKAGGRGMTASDEVLAENAALAIGASRLPAAFEILSRCRENCELADVQEMLLTPMALTRSDAAFDYLIGVLKTEERTSAIAAVEALRIFGDESRSARIQKADKGRNDRAITRAFEHG